MKDFLYVFCFYLLKQLRSKVFIFVTLFLFILSSVAMIAVPKLFSENKNTPIYVVNQSDELTEIFISNEFKENYLGILQVDLSMLDDNSSIAELEKKAKEENIPIVYFYNREGIRMKVIGNIRTEDINSLYNIVCQTYQIAKITELGVNPSVLEQSNPHINIELATIEENADAFGIIIIFSLVIVVFIVMYSSSATNEVAYLKTNRVMEMLSTSMKGVPLYLGINLAYAITPFIQVGTTLICVLLIKYIMYGETQIIMGLDLSILSINHVVIFVILLLLGYFIYSLINTAMVSFVNKSEDVMAISVPIAFIGFAQYFIGLIATTEDTLIVKLCSYIPLTSPTVMFIRYVFGFASIYEVLLSIFVLIGTIFLLVMWGSRVFTNGITYYSFKGNIRQILKIKDKL